MKALVWFAATVGAVIVLGTALGAQSEQVSSLEREARQIETMLIAPCCWSEQVSMHQSEAAEQVKREIRRMLAASMSRQQVLDAFVQQYGARVLAEPPNQGLGRALYYAPWLIGIGSVVLVALAIRRVSRHAMGGTRDRVSEESSPRPPAATDRVPSTGDASYDERVDEELRNLD